MTKDILISIKGLQFEMGSDEAVEMIAPGEYFFRNGKHYVRYEEIMEGADGEHDISTNTVKITKDQVEIIKKGGSNVHMVFAENFKNTTVYTTPFGPLQIGIFTNHIDVKEKEDVIEIKLYYDLEINQSFVSGCEITMYIMSKDTQLEL
ncbi:DUF1934 domain-containing protein [[Clostridium] polysaccharolyticum]|uniref:Uncharacterized beta-barrel protein YwiB, DUF1934 family n=1 Tax=[Clostridium] polysaccharolyticum TaxID=29364 RepID=A0A1I0FXW6_9FIRM|nr:DUF1934 domain-containing protein [[Clostridium] polysaccharolyticum]SET63222.1 Uncharacterized beta-barrel protein YwiB, DUF1934 family [[Clostridium] polysaccharolyticum]